MSFLLGLCLTVYSFACSIRIYSLPKLSWFFHDFSTKTFLRFSYEKRLRFVYNYGVVKADVHYANTALEYIEPIRIKGTYTNKTQGTYTN